MDIKQTKYEIQHLISGKSGASYDAIIQAVTNHLRSGKRSSPVAEEKHANRAQETAHLITFAKRQNLIIDDIPKDKFIASGAEQRVYIKGENVIKLNDAIYYASWEDYFYNLLLHNYFFTDTAYNFLGFFIEDKSLYAVIEQKFVKASAITNLSLVNQFLTNNGFINIRRHDYEHPELGIIIEDLHDENVLTYDGMLYFIDTVFYINSAVFWDSNI
jgi:hypothetical protein